MKKNILIITTLLVISLLVIYNKSKYMGTINNEPEATKISNYISEDKSFSFSYPDFEKWKSLSDIEHTRLKNASGVYTDFVSFIYYDGNTSGIMPHIMITKIYRPMMKAKGDKNSNGIIYTKSGPPENKIAFQTGGYFVEIAVIVGEREGFSAQVVLDEIIKSFKILGTDTYIIEDMKEFISRDDSFAFYYPDFEKWTSSIILGAPLATTNEGDRIVNKIMFSPPESEIWSGLTPEITVTKIYRREPIMSSSANPKRVTYVKNAGIVAFQGSGWVVEIQITAGETKSFSTQAVLDEIIKTFELRLEDLVPQP